jgi:hypothetical protein
VNLSAHRYRDDRRRVGHGWTRLDTVTTGTIAWRIGIAKWLLKTGLLKLAS